MGWKSSTVVAALFCSNLLKYVGGRPIAVATKAWLTALCATRRMFLCPCLASKTCCHAREALNHSSLSTHTCLEGESV